MYVKHRGCPEPSRCLIDGSRFVETDLSWVTQIVGLRSAREAWGGFLAGPVGREGEEYTLITRRMLEQAVGSMWQQSKEV